MLLLFCLYHFSYLKNSHLREFTHPRIHTPKNSHPPEFTPLRIHTPRIHNHQNSHPQNSHRSEFTLLQEFTPL
ncbi:hypothetical protein RHMOL_Rhmol02G0220400 [Rhododendron molle]|uniref:Uncharacterized protein n=1 Tax=Rhododendron molle TaxID=49168 RepID=A0ACC0PU78_RHOML|nr:hypothetical protein RHMOL_Rhmol02G0220400 [Rhododendron molle]